MREETFKGGVWGNVFIYPEIDGMETYTTEAFKRLSISLTTSIRAQTCFALF